MRLARDESAMGNQISRYQSGKITINKRDHTHSVVICANKILSPWTDKSASELTLDDFSPLLGTKPSVILIGTGETAQLLDTAIVAQLQAQGIGIEVMDTGAACRTYNVLISEGRDVVAGLFCR